MRVVDLAAQMLVLLRNTPRATGFIEDVDGKRYYISPANPMRHVHPAPVPDAKAVKFTIGDL